jgi:VWFA-related protein
MRHHAVVLCILGLAVAASAQDYHVEVRLVEVEVRVTDRSGAPVPDLTRSDFSLKEDGVTHDVATAQYLPVPVSGSPRWERTDGTPAEPVADAPATPTWIYVATEVAPTDARRAISAIREFLLKSLQPGFKVSLAGRAFTDDRGQLLSTLNQLERNPLGTDGRPGLVDLALPMGDAAAEDRAMAATFRRQQEGTAPLPGFVARPEAAEVDGSLARPFLTMGRADRQLPVYGDVTLNQYFDLVERLAKLPGKKAVVLMRPGLRLEPDNQGLLQDLASFAVRRRVSFYTVDSRGLDAAPPVEERNIPFMIDRRRRPGEPDLIGQMQERGLMREGLENLARETGGRAIIGTNRLADAFQKVVDDSSGYYVVSYYPVDQRQVGRFRSVKVDVSRPGVKVQQTTRGYYETRPQTLFPKDDRGLALRRAMQMTKPPFELPMAATVAHFASDDGFPVLVLSAGVPASALEPQRQKGAVQLSATAIIRIADAAGTRLPMYFERRLEAPLDAASLGRAQADRTAFVSMTDLLSLVPGDYDWRIVFRDEQSGRMGGTEGRVQMKDFRAPSVPSTLLLTRHVTRRADGSMPAAGDRQPLDAGPLRFSPLPSLVFHQGEMVHLLYTLYNATAEEMAAARRGMQLVLMRDGAPVREVEAYGEPLIDEGRQAVQFTGAINTRLLAPGAYRVISMLPNFEMRTIKHVEQRFLLLEKAAGS